MKIIKYFYTADFKKKIKNLPAKEKKTIVKKINLFLTELFSTNLKTHKLSGKLKNYWSFSIFYRMRVLFKFSKENIVEFIDFGGHEIYK